MNSKLARLERNVETARALLLDAEDQLRQALDSFTVLVEFRCGGTPYAYRYPEHWAKPEIGDEVVTPPTYNSGREQVVTVVGYGRGGYDGALRTLTGRVSRG